MVNFNTLRQLGRYFSTHQLVFRAYPSMPNGMKTGLVAFFLLSIFCRTSVQAQCDINYSITSFNLALDFNGEAYLNTASFYPTYVTSSSSNCNPPTGTLGIWENAGATVPYATSLPYPFTCNHVGNTYQVWVTLDDPAPGGQSSAILFNVTITDEEDPFIITPNVSNPYNVDPNTCARVLTFIASAADNCQSDLTYSYTLSGATTGGPFTGFIATHAFNVGTTTITWSVTDGYNPVTATTTVTVIDNQAPVFVGGSTPANGSTTTLAANASCQGTLTVTDPFASDNCSISSYTVTFDYPTGPDAVFAVTGGSTFTDTYPLGTTIVTYKMTDASGNMTTRTFNVLVTDQTAPVFAVNPTQTNVSTTTCFANVTLVRPATDNCNTPTMSFTINTVSGGPDPFLVEPVPGNDASGSYPVGVYYITFTAKDAANNMTMRTDTLTVVDNLPPTITSCSPFTAYLDANGNVVVDGLDFSPVASDNCGVDEFEIKRAPFASNPWQDTLQYHCADHGNTYNVRIRALDAAGNESAFCATTVTILDTLPPTAQCQNIVVNLDIAGLNSIVDSVDVFPIEINNGSTDNCTAPGSLNFRLRKGTSGPFEPLGTPLYFNCSELGVNTVTLRVGDTNGNPNFCTATVTVKDVTPPTAICQNPPNVLLDANGNGSLLASSVNNGSTDNCSVSSISVSPSSFNCSHLGGNTVTLTVTDGSGNTATCTATATVVDNLAPICTAPASDTIYLNASGNYNLSALSLSNGEWGDDNCTVTSAQIRVPPFSGIFATSWQNSINFDCDDIGPNTVRLRMTDQSGNQTGFSSPFCQTTLYVLDTIDPSAACINITVALNSGGTVNVSGFQVGIASADNCTGFLFLDRDIALDANGDGNPDAPFASDVVFDCDDIGNNNVLMQVTDGSGNTATCSATVTIQDLVDPTITCPADTTLLWVNGMTLDPDDIGNEVVIFPATPGIGDGIAADNCNVDVSWDDQDTVFSGDCDFYGYIFYIEREWTAVDSSGNVATCTQYITLIDTIAPTFTAPADATLNCPVSYSVANHLCNTWSNTTDVSISDVSTDTITSTITVPAGGKIQDVNVVDLQVSHTFISDLEIRLTSPDGTTIVLYDNSCGSQNNMDLDFDDDGAAYGTFPCPPIDQNTYAPFQSLSSFINEDASGAWTLTIIDFFNLDGGALTNWGLEICYVTPGTDTNSGTATNEVDDCDLTVDATFMDFQAFKDFQSNTANTKPSSTTYNFSTGAWTYTEVPSSDAFINLGGAPSSIAITSNNDGQPNTQANYSIQMPLTGNPGQYCIGFDWSYSSSNTHAGFDPFGYMINGTFFQLTDGAYCTFNGATTQSGRALVWLNPSDVFAFSQRSCDGIAGSATTTITNFVFIDKTICPVPAFDCPRDFSIARVWSMEDDCGNDAIDKHQIIRTQDNVAPSFGGFPSTVTVLAAGGVCAPLVNLNLSGYISDGCGSLDSVWNNALALYGKGNGLSNASDLYAPGTYTITFSALDECGNLGTHTVTLTVIDDQDPFAVCFTTINVQLDNTGNANITYVNIDNGSSDNCGIVNYSLSQSAFTTADIGQVPVVLTVTDAGGNQNTCTTVVNVLGGLTFDVGDASGVTGSMQNATVTVIDFNNITSFTLDLDITNTSVATLASPTSILNVSPLLTANGTFTPNQATAQVTWFANNPAGLTIPDNTPIFDVKLMLVGSAGQSTSMVVTNDDATQNVGGNPLVPVTTLGLAGTISIISSAPPVTISGTLQLEPMAPCSSQPIGQVTVSLSGTSSTPASPILNANGSYSFQVPSNSNPTITPSKNINWNNLGQVNIADVVAVNQHFLGITLLNSPYKRVAADANANGSIQISDVFAINQIAITNAPPVGLGNTSWRFIDGTAPLTTPALPNQVPSFNSSISFTNVTANQVANFIGVKTGDVNCSVNPANFGGGTVSDGSDNLPFFVENQAVEAGEELVVTFRAKDFINFIGYQTTLNFDSKALEFKEFVPLDLTNLSQANFNASAGEGMVATNWFNHEALNLPDGQALFQLKFTAKQDVTKLQGILEATSDFIQSMGLKGNFEETGVNLVFESSTAAGEVSSNGFALLQNRPNPFGLETIIGFVLPEGSNAMLTVMDASGRVLKVVEGDYSAGLHQVKISRNELPASGVVFYRLETPKHSAVKKMVIVD